MSASRSPEQDTEPLPAVERQRRDIPDFDSGQSLGEAPMSWAEHRAAGNEAWDQALAHDKGPQDDEATRLFWQASRHLRAAIFLRPDGQVQDPIDLVKIGGSQARLAEATPVGLLEGRGDRKSNLQDAAKHNLQRAAALLMGEGQIPEELEAEDTEEVVVEAFAEAANEAGTNEQVLPQTLDAEGPAGVERFIAVHGEVPGQGDEFMRVAAIKVVRQVEQLTGEHQLPAESRDIGGAPAVAA